jgi:transcriptional regulator of arginine metabolism
VTAVRSVQPLSAAAAKHERQRAILALVRSTAIRTQDELVSALGARHLDVTQATVSRDIRELGLVRVADPDGHRWVAPGDPAMSAAHIVDDDARLGSRLERVVRDHVVAVEVVDMLGVVHSRPSTAPLVAAALDQARLSEVAGTVAGDDTVLVVCRGRRAAARLEERLLSILGAGRPA